MTQLLITFNLVFCLLGCDGVLPDLPAEDGVIRVQIAGGSAERLRLDCEGQVVEAEFSQQRAEAPAPEGIPCQLEVIGAEDFPIEQMRAGEAAKCTDEDDGFSCSMDATDRAREPLPPPRPAGKPVTVQTGALRYTTAELRCENGFRQRAFIEEGSAVFPEVPDEPCGLSLKGGQPVPEVTVRGGAVVHCAKGGENVACKPVEIDVTDRLLPWTDEREQLALAYLRDHGGQSEPSTTMSPRMIVLHWTAGDTADGAWNTFEPAVLGGRPELGTGTVNVSAHFLVDRDGTTWRLLPDNRVARHVIGLNHLAIGIENVGGTDGRPLTDAQVEANAALIRLLVARHDITHLIGHLEYQAFEAHPYFQETDPDYRTTKPDPGADFMVRVREAVSDLALDGPP